VTGRIITSAACIDEGMAWLSARDPRLARAAERTGPLPLRRTADGFCELLSAIISQQVSLASAAALQARLDAAGMTTPEAVAAAGAEALRGLGLSRQKARYALALASAGIDYPALRDLPDEQVIARLMAVPGVGRWTAEIYAMFALGRADLLAAGDLALQEGARLVLDLPARPSERQLRGLAEEWTPWRAVAARLLWAAYARARAPAARGVPA
jgi:DNA-3-methyladenine glycosylase II